MGERWSPQRAKAWLESLGIDEDIWEAVIEVHPSLQMATSHELKAAVTIAKGARARDFSKVFTRMRIKYPG